MLVSPIAGIGGQRAASLYARYLTALATDGLPWWYSFALSHANLFAAYKNATAVRPIACPATDRAIVAASLLRPIKDQLPAVFGPVQLAFHKHGPHLLVTGMQALLDQRPDFLCLNTDLINAHNAFDRPVALDWLLRFEGGRFAFLLPFFRSQYASHARSIASTDASPATISRWSVQHVHAALPPDMGNALTLQPLGHWLSALVFLHV